MGLDVIVDVPLAFLKLYVVKDELSFTLILRYRNLTILTRDLTELGISQLKIVHEVIDSNQDKLHKFNIHS